MQETEAVQKNLEEQREVLEGLEEAIRMRYDTPKQQHGRYDCSVSTEMFITNESIATVRSKLMAFKDISARTQWLREEVRHSQANLDTDGLTNLSIYG
jgi:hypothetical protein